MWLQQGLTDRSSQGVVLYVPTSSDASPFWRSTGYTPWPSDVHTSMLLTAKYRFYQAPISVEPSMQWCIKSTSPNKI